MSINILESKELVSALIGAFVGGSFTLAGAVYEGRRQLKQLQRSSDEKRIATLTGVREEISSLISLYLSRMKEPLETYDRKSPFYHIFPITQNYFTFYEENSSFLAEVSSETLTLIVSFYTSARSLIDSYRGNNSLIEKIDSFTVTSYSVVNEQYKNHFERYYEIATDYGQGLIKIHYEVMQRYESCLDAINQEITLLRNELAD
jgi:hypothetical protein